MANLAVVKASRRSPAVTLRRPAEPMRPLPAHRVGVSLFAIRARRRRFGGVLPPRSGEKGW